MSEFYPMNIKNEPILRGKSLILRDAELEDSDFLLSLRLDPLKSRFLSQTSPCKEDQIAWMRHYKARSDQAYFIIEDRLSERLGCVRMYDPTPTSFVWGSWLIVDGAAPHVALESALLIYSYARRLGFKTAKLDVRQKNKNVWKFHERVFGAVLVRQDRIDRFYELDDNLIDKNLHSYRALLNG
jgi:hypothetical protein